MEMSDPPLAAQRLSDRAFDALAICVFFFAYLIVFAIVREGAGVASLVVSSLTNLAPVVVLTAVIRPVVRRHLIGATLPRQLAGHTVLALIFSFFWHWLLLVLLGIRSGGSLTEFTVRAFFPEPALAWQLLQGVTVYAVIAALTYARSQPDLPSFVDAGSDDWQKQETSLERYFIRHGDDIQPVDVSQIICIAGADDYAEVTTAEGRHLVRTTLAKFEASLNPEQFLRVHRSRIVNLRQISRAEPAGDGRLLLHMNNGEQFQTSRAGAKLMRNHVL